MDGPASEMKLPRLYPILSTDALQRCGVTLEAAAEAMLAGGAEILQFRHKGHWSDRELKQAEWLAAQCQQTGALFVINDRADIAKLVGAALHLGQQDLPPSEVRQYAGIIGLSTHNEIQLRAAATEPIEYIALGPIFGTQSKENPDPVVGLSELARLRPLTEKPLVAIGGITLDNAAEVIRAGADSVAIISGLLSGPQRIRQTTELWRKQLSSLQKHS